MVQIACTWLRQLVAFEPLSQAFGLIISRNSEAFMLTSQSMTILVFFSRYYLCFSQ